MNEEIVTDISQEENTEQLNENISEEIPEPQQRQSLCESEVSESELSESDEVAILKDEICSLRKALEEKNSAYERMSREIGEFSELFPDRNVSTVPDSVWESVRGGIPLAAAYALYEKRMSVRAAEAERVNAKNTEASTGPIGRSSDETFFTPDEVRAMSRREVRQNYSKILESMQKWN